MQDQAVVAATDKNSKDVERVLELQDIHKQLVTKSEKTEKDQIHQDFYQYAF